MSILADVMWTSTFSHESPTKCHGEVGDICFVKLANVVLKKCWSFRRKICILTVSIKSTLTNYICNRYIIGATGVDNFLAGFTLF